MSVRPVGRWALLLAIGFGYGLATSHIPAPHGTRTFWIGNLCAPWPLIAFLAGRTRLGPAAAAAYGASIDVACVVGFYIEFLSFDPGRLDLPSGTGPRDLILVGLHDWFAFTGFWLTVATVAGAAYGFLGWRWRRDRPVLVAFAVAAPLIAEPFLWRLRTGQLQSPWALWMVEVAIGLALLAVLISRSGKGRPHGSCAPGWPRSA